MKKTAILALHYAAHSNEDARCSSCRKAVHSSKVV